MTGTIVDRTRLGLPVVFGTDHELVVVKPSGMATELTSDPNGVSLLSRIRASAAAGATPRLPHRLDRATRGLVVVALSDDAVRFHNERIRERMWEKLYLARVNLRESGRTGDLVGLHTVHLRIRSGRAAVVRSGGKRAVTELLAIAPAPDRKGQAHALLRLHTGRTHQIRATMAALGAPLVGDRLYGSEREGTSGRFYLEHVALEFTPYGAQRPRWVHWRDDPDRETIDGAIRSMLDRRMEEGETSDAEER